TTPARYARCTHEHHVARQEFKLACHRECRWVLCLELIDDGGSILERVQLRSANDIHCVPTGRRLVQPPGPAKCLAQADTPGSKALCPRLVDFADDKYLLPIQEWDIDLIVCTKIYRLAAELRHVEAVRHAVTSELDARQIRLSCIEASATDCILQGEWNHRYRYDAGLLRGTRHPDPLTCVREDRHIDLRLLNHFRQGG